jgi:endonuclease/exonuclease/phosphatase family metal-dependent hydrolase
MIGTVIAGKGSSAARRLSKTGPVRLRLLTYNIHKCIGGLDRRYRPERIEAAIRHYEPDIVILQEVDEGARRSNRDRQVDLLAEGTGLRHGTWFPNVRVRGGGAYGNAILSRFPLVESRNIDLTVPGKKRRSVLHASCRIPLSRGGRARTLHIFNLHLGLSGRERGRQLKRFLESHPFVGLHQKTPIVVGGDFNDVWGTLGGLYLVPAGFQGHGRPQRTFPAYAPVRALDSIYVKGDVRIASMYRSHLGVAKQASDHLPLFAELEIR